VVGLVEECCLLVVGDFGDWDFVVEFCCCVEDFC